MKSEHRQSHARSAGISRRALFAAVLSSCVLFPALAGTGCKSNAIDNRNIEATCAANFVDCNRDPADGCEVNVAIDVANCGACGRTCAAANANGAGTCVDGQCKFACSAGFADCNLDGADGCETDLSTTAEHCGACDTACKATNAGPACKSGVCTVGACNAGYADCNSKAADGCEVKPADDANNCGSCGKACGTGNRLKSCTGGQCSTACAPGYHACGGDCEADDSATACGASCTACPAGPNGSAAACIAGACDFSPLVVVASADVASLGQTARPIAVGDRDIFWISGDKQTIYQARKDGTSAPTAFMTLAAGNPPQIRAWKTDLVWGTALGKVFRTSQDAPNQANPTVIYDGQGGAPGRATVGWDVAGDNLVVADYTVTNPNPDSPGFTVCSSISVRGTNLATSTTTQLFQGVTSGCPAGSGTVTGGPNHVCLQMGFEIARCGVVSGPSTPGNVTVTGDLSWRVALLGPQFALLARSAGNAVLPKRALLPAGTPTDLPVALATAKQETLRSVASTPQGFVASVASVSAAPQPTWGLWHVQWDGSHTVLWPTPVPGAVAADQTYAYVHDASGLRILRFKLR